MDDEAVDPKPDAPLAEPPAGTAHGDSPETTPGPGDDAGRARRLLGLAAGPESEPDAATGAHTPGPAADPTAEYHPSAAAGAVIAGRYVLQEKLGEGGMGEVWVAKQTEPVKRKVALKLIRPGMDSRAVLQRFEQERQALALMDHPHIARVLDAGLTPDGRPFFAMELVNGLPLTRFCDEAKLTPRERLELFMPICQAVQHAHLKGVVHRDLKPANILVTIVDDRPIPKVIDFGVAKATAGRLTDESLSTQFGAVLGTLEYMSPEQAGLAGEDIDTRSDIYSLGVILYELLTGLRPIDARRFRQAALTEMIRIIREEEPSKPSTRLSTDASAPSLAAVRRTEPRKLTALLRGDLDWVVMKCLEKPRDRRYETANGLARDIQRYLDDEPVEARPPSAGYRLGKFVRRHRGPVIAASLVLLALVAGIIGTTYGVFRARQAAEAERLAKLDAQEKRAEAEKQKARAESRERQAIDAVKRFRDAVAENPELKDNPELDSLRKELLREPLAFFRSLRDRLQVDGDTRPESLDRLAAASFELGVLTAEIGDKQDALTAHREALAIWKRLADGLPAAVYQANLATSHGNLGALLLATGQAAEARAAYEEALAIQQRLAAAHPNVPEYERRLAGGHYDLGALLSATGHPSEARASFEAARAIRQRLADAHPNVTNLQRDLARSHNSLGALLLATGQPAQSQEAYEDALAIQQRLSDAHPAVTVYRSDLAHTHNFLGNLLYITGQPAQARAAYEDALAIRQRLSDAHPTATAYQCDLARSHGNLGNLLATNGQPAEARAAYEDALAIFEKLAAAHPAVTEHQSDLAQTHNNLGNLLVDNGQPAQARAPYQAALAIRQRLADAHPEAPAYAGALGGTLNDLAKLDLDAHQFAAAANRLRKAIAWQKKALAAYPRDPIYRKSLRSHYTNLLKAARGLDDADLAADADRGLAELDASDPRLVALETRLAAILGGEPAKDNAERLALAKQAYDTKRYGLAARLWGEALEADPKLAADRQAQHRYNAACAAALAAAGQAKNEPAPDEPAKVPLRRRARGWLEAELDAWEKFLNSGATPNAMTRGLGAPDRDTIRVTLEHWKQDSDLAGVRGDAIEALPEADRAAFQQLWADVDVLLEKVTPR